MLSRETIRKLFEKLNEMLKEKGELPENPLFVNLISKIETPKILNLLTLTPSHH